MSRPNWRDPAEYEHLLNADVATLAGEFLKRNSNFQADRRRLTRLAAQHELTMAERDTFALAWGVRFRGERSAPDMDTAGAPHRRRRGRDATDASRVVTTR